MPDLYVMDTSVSGYSHTILMQHSIRSDVLALRGQELHSACITKAFFPVYTLLRGSFDISMLFSFVLSSSDRVGRKDFRTELTMCVSATKQTSCRWRNRSNSIRKQSITK